MDGCRCEMVDSLSRGGWMDAISRSGWMDALSSVG